MTRLFVILPAVLLAGGCIQTLPDGSIAAAPGTAALTQGGGLDSAGQVPPDWVVARDSTGRPVSWSSDPHLRSSLQRDPCQLVATAVQNGCTTIGN
jgi:hypothetical protein